MIVIQDKTSDFSGMAKFLTLVVLLSVLYSDCIFALRPECSGALGMEDNKIKDWQLTSHNSDSGYEAKYARLHNDNAWCSDSKNPWIEYLQIRLDRIRHISGIATQGYKSTFFISYYVKRYSMKYSYDGRVWYWYKDSASPNIKEFNANSDANTVKKISLRDTFVTKYLRIYPLEFKDDMCMRVELYGCPINKDCTAMLTQTSGGLSSPNYPLPYPMGSDCTWIIQLADINSKVTLLFEYFNVNNGTSKSCQGDYVEAINGIRDISPSLGRFCNGMHIPIIKSSENALRLRFHSEWLSSAMTGFKATYYSDDVVYATACINSSLSLSCSSSPNSIKILHVMYGNLPFSTKCGSLASSKPCIAAGALQTVTTKCQHYKVCKLKVSSPVFTLSCNGSLQVPHLDVYYQCTGNVIKTKAPEISTTIAPHTTAPPPTVTNPSTSTTTDSTPIISTIEPSTAASPPVIKTTSKDTEPSGSDEGDTLASVKEKSDVRTVVGVVVGLVVVVIVVLTAVICFLYRRRKKQNKKPTAGVTYTAPRNSFNAPHPGSRTGRGSSRTNPYETVNVLYVSADDPNLKDEEQEHVYDSPELLEPLPKMTDNPLYHAFDSLHDHSGYENVDKAKLPSSLDPAIYDKPLDTKTNTATSISNPNYGKGIEMISDK